jgi:hypothetical protein
MQDIIPWDTLASNEEGPCGTLREVIVRWKADVSRDQEDLTGVNVLDLVFLAGWPSPTMELWPQHLNELSDHLPTQRDTPLL